MSRIHVGEFNDSFPPTIDGVAQTVKNYASILQEKHCDVTVVTPNYKGVTDHYPFDVFRYHSIPLDKRIGYRAGNPFSPDTLIKLHNRRFDLMHVHAPFASSILVKNINHHPRVPVVLTYHTQFDIDIEKRVKLPEFRKIALRFVLENIKAVDEVWVVTKGCGDTLRRIGYQGGYRVMENGTDFAFGQAEEERVAALRDKYAIPDDALVFLFVGRMMWYKNIRLILDSLARVKAEGLPFRALMVGDGFDAPAIRQYAAEIGLQEEAIFTGAVYNRDHLRVYYSLADLFLFPSTYDTSGIVVKEAAACSCPSLLVRGSCASEGVEDGVSGFLAEENADDCARVLLEACRNREALARTGEQAGRSIYLSWETAVGRAYDRYREILDAWPAPLPHRKKYMR